MKNFDPSIDVQNFVLNQILDALHCDILLAIRSHTTREQSSLFDSKSYREGNCFKIDANSLPDLHRICQEVIETLNYTEQIDFYLSGNSDINAFSWEAEDEGEPNLIEINSGLFNLMTEDELKFVIGHEIGHLISHDMMVKSLVSFAYPDENTIPPYIDERRVIHNHLSEFIADRYGYLANHNLEACVSALYKLTSGIDLQKLEVPIPALIENNEQHIKFFLEEDGEMFGDHPVNPLRVQALHVYSTAQSQEEIDDCIHAIVNCLCKKLFNDSILGYTAAAGILMATVDGELSDKELAVIYEYMGADCFCPEQVLDEFKDTDWQKLLDESIPQILTTFGLTGRERMFRYALKVMLADGSVTSEEIDFAYELGDKLQLSNAETTDLITEAMRSDYLPKITVENDNEP